MAEAQQNPNVEEEEEECPKCPPKGAPAWMATFADMATLLMAFFVLILSFAEFNVPKFKQTCRNIIKSQGYEVVMSLGDNIWDIGDKGGLGILLKDLPFDDEIEFDEYIF